MPYLSLIYFISLQVSSIFLAVYIGTHQSLLENPVVQRPGFLTASQRQTILRQELLKLKILLFLCCHLLPIFLRSPVETASRELALGISTECQTCRAFTIPNLAKGLKLTASRITDSLAPLIQDVIWSWCLSVFYGHHRI